MKIFLLVILFSLLVVSCKDEAGNEKEIQTTTTELNIPSSLSRVADSALQKDSSAPTGPKDKSKPKPLRTKDSILLLELTRNILSHIRAGNYTAIVKYIDPVSGVRFSPYAYVDTSANIVLSKEKFSEQATGKSKDTILWGEFDATGEAIRMTLDQYIRRFVYDVDFARPEKRSVNKFLGFGNSLNNLLLIYKDCDFTESYFSGFEAKYEGMDWRTLRLVFKERNNQFYLVGIVHDQWTS